MNTKRKLTRRIRARMAKTGESYTTARKHVLSKTDSAPESPREHAVSAAAPSAAARTEKTIDLAEIPKRKAELSPEEKLAHERRLRDLVEGTNPLKRMLEATQPMRDIVERQQRFIDTLQMADPLYSMRDMMLGMDGFAGHGRRILEGATAIFSVEHVTKPVMEAMKVTARRLEDFRSYTQSLADTVNQTLAANSGANSLGAFREEARALTESIASVAIDEINGNHLREIAALAKGNVERMNAFVQAARPLFLAEVDRMRDEIERYSKTFQSQFDDQMQALNALPAASKRRTEASSPES